VLQQLLHALLQLPLVVSTQHILADHESSTHGQCCDSVPVETLGVQEVSYQAACECSEVVPVGCQYTAWAGQET
jgi:hypothetical protein